MKKQELNFTFDFPVKPKIGKMQGKNPEECQKEFNVAVDQIKNYMIDVENVIKHN